MCGVVCFRLVLKDSKFKNGVLDPIPSVEAATCLFVKVGSLDRVLLLGRWTAIKTAKNFLNSGLAMLADIQISTSLLRPFHLTYFNFLSSNHTLEPAQKSRSGGRGNNPKKAKKGRKLAKKAKNEQEQTLMRLKEICRTLFVSLKCLRPSLPRLGGDLGSTGE